MKQNGDEVTQFDMRQEACETHDLVYRANIALVMSLNSNEEYAS